MNFGVYGFPQGLGVNNGLLGSTEKIDPFLDKVVLYLQGNGVNNGTVFTDSSKYNHSIIRGGTDIVTSTTQSKYGGASLFSSANNINSILTIPNNPVFDIGLKNFTIEFWYYKTSNSFLNNIVEIFTLDGLDYPLAIYDGSFVGNQITLAWGTNNSSWVNNDLRCAPAVIALNQWHHIAFCRLGGYIKAFFNGVNTNTVTDSTNIGVNGSLTLMNANSQSVYGAILGYIDNFRFTMDGRYFNNFDPEHDTFMKD